MLFSLGESEKFVGNAYGSSNTEWKHFKIQVKPSRYEKQVNFSRLLNVHYREAFKTGEGGGAGGSCQQFG